MAVSIAAQIISLQEVANYGVRLTSVPKAGDVASPAVYAAILRSAIAAPLPGP
jgi:hypothetical protein